MKRVTTSGFFLLIALLAPASAAQGQRLLTLMPGVGQAASTGDPGPSIGPVPTVVQVDLALLRAAPLRLEVPTPDGSVLSAARSVFEDRGGGDLMWSGGQPGAGYDTVVLTVEGGRLVGRFGAAGGGAYQIHAERDGRGGMAPVVGPSSDGSEPWCGVDMDAEGAHDAHAHSRAGAFSADLPEAVSNPQSHDRLDILVVYTATAAENWAGRGGALAAIRHAGDYLKMVFRNNSIPVEPHILHIAQAPAALDRAGRVLERHDMWRNYNPLDKQMFRDGGLRGLQHEHRADFVHVFTGEHRLLLQGFCGAHTQFRKGYTAASFSGRARGWTTNHPDVCGDYVVTFAHEIGHGLGAHHDRANLVGFASRSARRRELESLFRPDSLGYPNFDVMPSLGTAMSYLGQTEPFFSTPRIRPWGAGVGVADQADNERTVRETVHIGVRYSDYLRSLEGVPAAPSGLQVRFDGGVAHLSWRDNAPDADGYEVEYLWESEYLWEAQDRERAGHRIVTVEGRTGAILPLEYTEPGSLYRFNVRAVKGEVRSLDSSEVWLVVPGEPIAAPSDVSVVVARDLGRVDVRWTDNSDNEWAFEVQLLKDGEPIQRDSYYWQDDASAAFPAHEVDAEAGAEYGVRVFAYNSSGYSESSEVVSFRWEHPSGPGPVADVAATATGPTTVRVTWTPDPEVERYGVEAELRGWYESRRWFPPRNGSVSAAWVDFEGLPRGGRYKFSVTPWAGLGSHAFLTLGERGMGPEAPSGVSWTKEEGGNVLSWTDNSNDELGFEIQSAPIGTEFWWRVGIVPPGTESVTVTDVSGARGRPQMGKHVVRVFAYNDRGFSASSPRVPERPVEPPPREEVRASFRLDIPCEEDLCRTFTDALVSFTDTSGGNVTEWLWSFGDGATSDLRSPTHVWSTPGFYDVTLTVSDGSSSDSASRRVVVEAPARVPLKASFRLDIPCGEDLCRTFTDALVSFTDASGGNVTEWLWGFGDGAISDLRSPTHVWSTPGFYEVTLTVSDGSSSDSASRRVVVEAPARVPLKASFRLDIPCEEDLCRTFTDALVSFTDASGGNVTEWLWSFGDGAISDLRSPTHVWSTPGFYEVTLTVSDGSSSDSASRRVVVEAPARVPLKASFRLDIPCEEDLCRTFTDALVSFTDTSGGNVTEWRWSFGDGATSDLRSPTHVWSTPGFYDVTLTVSDGSSADSATRTLLVEAAVPAGSCRVDEETTCLQNSRFEVKANWWKADGEAGAANVVGEGTDDSGLFRFFDPENWEILVKVLDGCGINGRTWVLGASTTDLGYRIVVTDTVTGESRSYENEPGQPAPAIVDTKAFAQPCAGGAGP